MVGGLIEQHEVGRHHEHAGQGIAIAFAAGKHADGLEDIVFGEEEATEDAAQFGIGGAWSDGRKVVDQARVLVEFLVLVLREIVGLGVVTEEVFPRGHGLGAGQNLDHGGLARALDAHQGDAGGALDDQVAIGKNQVIAVGFGDLLELGHDTAARFGLGKTEMDGLLAGRNLNPFDLLQFLNAALHLFGLGGLGAEAVDEGFQLLDAVLLVGVGGKKLRAPLLFQYLVAGIAAGVNVEAFVPELDDFAHGDVEEVAVVGNQHVRVRVGGEILFQPVAGFQVEVVGGLVEEQQVGFLQEKFGQRDAHLPAAGELFGAAFPIALGEAEAAKYGDRKST